ncbi:hypothetical protein [[Mycoplasma] testudinis]|uniref:hypothetical protein n=1 Tax=[Mycoplasma] testudinis TaxID=33924 RepID=UPI00048640A2|nr:hypothetical protein [[Mycoplasma] testudinis]
MTKKNKKSKFSIFFGLFSIVATTAGIAVSCAQGSTPSNLNPQQEKAKDNFQAITKNDNKSNVILLNDNDFTLRNDSFLGVDYAINAIADGILGPDNKVSKMSIFDLSHLSKLSANNFNFSGEDRRTANNYDFVANYAPYLGNLAAIGFLPTTVINFNKETTVPSYIQKIITDNKVNEEFNTGPATFGNNEATSKAQWVSRNPNTILDFSKLSKPDEYGFKNSLANPTSFGADISKEIRAEGQTAINTAKLWDLMPAIKSLIQEVSNVVTNKDGSNIFGITGTNPAAVLTTIQKNYDAKIKEFKDEMNARKIATPTVSFWGKGYGPNTVNNSESYNEYGPGYSAGFFPSWLYGSADNELGFKLAVPEDSNFKFGVFDNGGFNSAGWITTGSYNPNAVQAAFKKSSDYVFVALN